MLDRYDQDLLLDYLEGELDADRRAQLDAMLAEDPQLAALLGEMAQDREALRSLPQAEAPSDLVHDVTQTLERRMLLDDTVVDDGPIPLSRGRGLPTEPSGGMGWGRIVGLTGLAASVAIAAGIVVISLEHDPLGDTADHLADNTAEVEDEDEAAETFASNDNTALDEASGLADAARNAADGPEIVRTPGPTASEDLPAPDAADKPWEGKSPLAEGIDSPADALAGATHDSARTPGNTPIPPSIDPDGVLRTGPLGRAVALSAVQPRQQLVLVTEEPELSREQLLTFCVANGIPIVQADNNTYKQRQDLNTADRLADDGDIKPDEQFFTSTGDYALLIDERQLEQLVVSFNNDVNIQPTRAGKASLFSNQAAVLTELPTAKLELEPFDDAAEQAPEEAKDAHLDQANANTYGAVNSQQPLQLRLPQDLGSDYANTRNEYNLNLSQKRGAYRATPDYAQYAADDQVERRKTIEELNRIARSSTPDPNAEAQDQPLVNDPPNQARGGGSEGALEEADLPDGEGTPPQPADPQDIEAARVVQVDATRGNWLTQHLPLAHTTQLLDWRTEAAARPPKLIPVAIKQAPAEKVNNLRMRQQSEYASRERREDKPAESATDQVDRATRDVTAAEAEAAEATPEAQPAPETEPAE